MTKNSIFDPDKVVRASTAAKNPELFWSMEEYLVNNGSYIDWGHWKKIDILSPMQMGCLVNCVCPSYWVSEDSPKDPNLFHAKNGSVRQRIQQDIEMLSLWADGKTKTLKQWIAIIEQRDKDIMLPPGLVPIPNSPQAQEKAKRRAHIKSIAPKLVCPASVPEWRQYLDEHGWRGGDDIIRKDLRDLKVKISEGGRPKKNRVNPFKVL